MNKFAKNARAKSDEFALLVGDLVYTLHPYHVFFRAVVILGLKAKLNFSELSIGTKINLKCMVNYRAFRACISRA